MSISNRHPLNAFVSGKSEPMAGQRLAKIGYKSSKTAPARFPSVCASVPMIDRADVDAKMERLLPHVIRMLEDAQDSVIRSLYESSDGSLSAVSDADISVDACIGYLEAQKNGGRISGELIGSWFDAHLSDVLTIAVAEKLGYDLSTPEQEDTVSKNVNAYRALLVSIAGNKTRLNAAQISGVRKVLSFSSDLGDIGGYVEGRLKAMEGKGMDLIDLL